MHSVFLILFLAVSLFHLYDCWRDSDRRKKSKPFLLLFLILFYVCAVKQPLVFLLLALITCWLGDVLLIPKGHGWFTAGGISFLFGHVFFILTYAGQVQFEGQPVWLLILAALLYFCISFLIMRAVMPTTPKPMVVPMFLYLLANSLMNLFALMLLTTHRNAGAVIAYIGAVLFFISDCSLFLVRYYKDETLIFKKHFTVMLTYIASVFLIVHGIIKLLK